MLTLKILRIVTMCVLIAMMTGCTALQDLITSSQNIYIKTDTVEGVIFNADTLNPNDVKYFIYAKDNRNPDSYWTPTEDDVLTLEAKLPAYLKIKIGADHYAYGLWDKLAGYKRQYVGYVLDGEQFIYTNYFCDSFNDDAWKTQLLMVMDGGECFFQVQYQLANQSFVSLSINGFA